MTARQRSRGAHVARAPVALTLVALLVSAAQAQTGGGYDLTWNTIDGGGTFSTGGGYELGGTAGQPDAGTSSGAGFVLDGGFWAGVSAAPPAGCVGDCGGDGAVTVDELLTMVNIALGNAPVTECPEGDGSGDGQITVDEILTAVNNALNGCG
jgi:hypothetical protein